MDNAFWENAKLTNAVAYMKVNENISFIVF